MDMATEIRQQLLGNMIIGRCQHKSGIIFRLNRCSGTRCIRFTTETINAAFRPPRHGKGTPPAEYEIYNDGTSLCFQLSLNAAELTPEQRKTLSALLPAAGSDGAQDSSGIIALRRWEHTIGDDVKKAQAILDIFFTKELPAFEEALLRQQREPDCQEEPSSEPDDSLTEGEEIQALSTRFERNAEARAQCIAYYGTRCRICGFDFGKTYGPAFAGIIEVHHIVPVSEIRKNYVVDPIHDLIPVCPNCHTALHSKPGGVYTPEELRQLIEGKRSMIRV